MANETSVASASSARGQPIPYITAVWAGVPMDEIVAGLAAGTILSPSGAPAGWRPGGAAAATDTGSETSALQADARAILQSAGNDKGSPAQGVVDRAQVSTWLRALDPGLDAGGFDRIWAAAGATDAQRASVLSDFLGKTLLGSAGGVAGDSAARSALDRFTDNAAHRATVVDLSGMTGAELAGLAGTDIGYRHALQQMQPLALVGNRGLFAAVNADGHLDRFDPDTGEALLSDAWLADRGKFMAWRSAEIAGANTALASAQGWTFTDHGQVSAEGSPLVVNLQGTDASAEPHQVIFGNATAETLRGGSGTDRIYGGAGADTLRGGAGADRLEGGDGDDLAMGGAGNDQLLGNRGADELDGGGGRDVLVAGSGDDVLAGGGGDDRLEGGAGRDTYLFDAGDGRDTIDDADGQGSIVVDGIAVSGAMAPANDGWTTADGRFVLAFDGSNGEVGTLTIRSTAPDASAGDAIVVEDWTNGDLGISLQGLDTASPTPATDAQATNLPQAGEAGVTTTSSDIHYGDTAPYQGTSSGSGPADTADAVASAVDASAGSPADAPGDTGDGADGNNSGSTAEAFDFDAALAGLLGSPESNFNAIDPAHIQQAIDAFSGVLEPPDVHQGASAIEADGFDALTDADIADALAANSADYDADEVPGTPTALRAPELLQTEGLALQADSGTTVPMTSSTAQRR